MIEIEASYTGPLNNDKELELFGELKRRAAEEHPSLRVGGSRFEVTVDGAGVERHTHYLTLFDPKPEADFRGWNGVLGGPNGTVA